MKTIESQSQTLQKVRALKNQLLIDLLNQCTAEQQLNFKRMYSHKDLEKPIENVVKDLPDDRYDWAVCQCERTIASNLKKQQPA
jgi:hypothetical protein